MGIAGAAAGVGLGYAGAGIIGAVAPKLSADVPGNFNPNSYTPNPAKGPGPGTSLSAYLTTSTGGKTPAPTHLRGSTGEPSLSHTVAITLHPAVTLDVIALAVALALLGGLLAGSLASWRIARLRPATALSRVALRRCEDAMPRRPSPARVTSGKAVAATPSAATAGNPGGARPACPAVSRWCCR